MDRNENVDRQKQMKYRWKQCGVRKVKEYSKGYEGKEKNREK